MHIHKTEFRRPVRPDGGYSVIYNYRVIFIIVKKY